MHVSIKTGLFFSLNFYRIKDHYYYGKFKKKLGENKNKLRTIYPKNHANFKNSKSRSSFTGSCKKECV